jgi:hypothetical protein
MMAYEWVSTYNNTETMAFAQNIKTFCRKASFRRKAKAFCHKLDAKLSTKIDPEMSAKFDVMLEQDIIPMVSKCLEFAFEIACIPVRVAFYSIRCVICGVVVFITNGEERPNPFEQKCSKDYYDPR